MTQPPDWFGEAILLILALIAVSIAAAGLWVQPW